MPKNLQKNRSSKNEQSSFAPLVELPPDTIELRDELVPVVRGWLRQGLSDAFQRSCVRIGEFESFSGGLKADLIGGLRIDVHTVLKLGSDELNRHAVLMTHINNLRSQTFPLILRAVSLKNHRVFLLMEKLRSHVTLLDKVYKEQTTTREINYILERVCEAMRVSESF